MLSKSQCPHDSSGWENKTKTNPLTSNNQGKSKAGSPVVHDLMSQDWIMDLTVLCGRVKG